MKLTLSLSSFGNESSRSRPRSQAWPRRYLHHTPEHVDHGKAWGYVAHNLMEGVVLPDVKRVQRFFLSQREIQLTLAKAQEPHRT